MMRRFLIAYNHTAIAVSAILEVVNEYAILNLDAVFVIEFNESFNQKIHSETLSLFIKVLLWLHVNYFT